MRSVTSEDLPLESLYRWERERGGRIFLTQPFDGGKVRDWTWAQTADEARRMAAFLKARNFEPGSCIAVLSKNCAWSILADLAIWMSGHITVPVYPSLRAQSVCQILTHCGAKACFLGPTDEREAVEAGIPPDTLCIRFPAAPPGAGVTWEETVASTAPIPGSPTRPANDVGTIIYTSGTTGLPKGVMHTFYGFAFDAVALTERLELVRNEQRFVSYLPLAHVVERGGVEGPSMLHGSRVFFVEGVETFVADLQRARPTIFLSVPRLLLKFQQGVFAKVRKEKLERLLRIPIINRTVKRKILRQLGLFTVRHAACGAAALPTEILGWYRNLGLDLAEGYGMSETLITHLPPPGGVRAGYVGTPLDGVEQKLTAAGELLIRSPMNMVGYYHEPQATQDAFTEDGFFRTGDLAEIAADGQLKLIGRVKEQFKTSKGKYVAPAPIESRLAAHPSVEACCLMGAGLPNPCAMILLTPEARQRCADPDARKALEQSLQLQMDQVNATLDPHEQVTFMVIADGPWSIANGLMTPTLKLKRHSLELSYVHEIQRWKAENRAVVWESTPQ